MGKIKKEKMKEFSEKNAKKAKKVMGEFKTFALKGNILDLAIGMIIGTAFTKIVNSLVNEVIMPALSLITGRIDFTNLFISLDGKTYETLDAAKAAGVATVNYGTFISSVIDFLLVAIVIFIFMRYIFKKRKEEPAPEVAPTTKKCPYCISEIPIEATRCAHCTSILEETK